MNLTPEIVEEVMKQWGMKPGKTYVLMQRFYFKLIMLFLMAAMLTTGIIAGRQSMTPDGPDYRYAKPKLLPMQKLKPYKE